MFSALVELVVGPVDMSCAFIALAHGLLLHMGWHTSVFKESCSMVYAVFLLFRVLCLKFLFLPSA